MAVGGAQVTRPGAFGLNSTWSVPGIELFETVDSTKMSITNRCGIMSLFAFSFRFPLSVGGKTERSSSTKREVLPN